MKDIGSIFPLYQEDLHTRQGSVVENENVIYFSLCREALYAVAQSLESTNKVVLMPAYTCDTVYQPFKQLGWTCVFYSINKDLTIDIKSLLMQFHSTNPSLVIAHPYFGMELDEEETNALWQLKHEGTKLLIDNTQCIFSKEHLDFVDYYTGSYRKWFPIPDGGFLESKMIDGVVRPTEENSVFVAVQEGAMYLRGEYFCSENEDVKALSIHLNKTAVSQALGPIALHKMSDFSLQRYFLQDFRQNQESRMVNYRYLYNHLKHNLVSFVCEDIDRVTSAPLYFPIYTDERSEIQRHLAAQHIYLPIIWPAGVDESRLDENINFIYNHILCIPIDQRYTTDDMARIVEKINSL